MKERRVLTRTVGLWPWWKKIRVQATCRVGNKRKPKSRNRHYQSWLSRPFLPSPKNHLSRNAKIATVSLLSVTLMCLSLNLTLCINTNNTNVHGPVLSHNTLGTGNTIGDLSFVNSFSFPANAHLYFWRCWFCPRQQTAQQEQLW